MDTIKKESWAFLDRPEAYCEAWRNCGKAWPLVEPAVRRQFATAKAILERMFPASGDGQRGVLLADDVGLGKTAVAGFVAWVFASAGGRVRVLAPNDTVRRNWGTELEGQVPPLKMISSSAKVPIIRDGVEKLCKGHVGLWNHSRLRQGVAHFACDLLIVDEAHRSKGEETDFKKKLSELTEKPGHVGHLLFLTATPFGISVGDLESLLKYVGAPVEARSRVTKTANFLASFWSGERSGAGSDVLAGSVRDAVVAIKRFVIRHVVLGLPDEEKAFGEGVKPWGMKPISADEGVLSVLIRADRALALARKLGLREVNVTNDPRFHVGWLHLDRTVNEIEGKMQGKSQPDADRTVLTRHLSEIQRAREEISKHQKVAAVCDEVKQVLPDSKGMTAFDTDPGKVLVFCHHHATAAEIGRVLDEALGRWPPASSGSPEMSERAWSSVLGESAGEESKSVSDARRGLIAWLSSNGNRLLVQRWCKSDSPPRTAAEIKQRLNNTGVYGLSLDSVPTIAKAAKDLFQEIAKSDSARSLFAKADERLPFWGGKMNRVMIISTPDDDIEATVSSEAFYTAGAPDTAMFIFNSPFGPDVMVCTDKLSEGVNLHRYCHRLVHYELSPSPVRVMQRNGRVRRLGGWAGKTQQPILVAYPAFGGTRDERLVEIMNGRLKNFDLLMGGLGHDVLEAPEDNSESIRLNVVKEAGKMMKDCENALAVYPPVRPTPCPSIR